MILYKFILAVCIPHLNPAYWCLSNAETCGRGPEMSWFWLNGTHIPRFFHLWLARKLVVLLFSLFVCEQLDCLAVKEREKKRNFLQYPFGFGSCINLGDNTHDYYSIFRLLGYINKQKSLDGDIPNLLFTGNKIASNTQWFVPSQSFKQPHHLAPMPILITQTHDGITFFTHLFSPVPLKCFAGNVVLFASHRHPNPRAMRNVHSGPKCLPERK
ncbi:hypothetical protein QBC38DRAFT_9543 [Podospora fimiseda]|uniref:Uncharacterized protein n=1 Tax=Podospora fimiseda TaxID=252190 RepID=A0AAN7BWB2_9PEZI|nr:hypothetical protein QBC38DRAFT_9543 [Podospora fimiseda]